MVQRNPDQSLSLGRYSGAMTTHQLPCRSTGRRPHRDVNTFGGTQLKQVARERGCSQVDKNEAAPNSKPIRGNFCALMSSPREISQQVQKRV